MYIINICVIYIINICLVYGWVGAGDIAVLILCWNLFCILVDGRNSSHILIWYFICVVTGHTTLTNNFFAFGGGSSENLLLLFVRHVSFRLLFIEVVYSCTWKMIWKTRMFFAVKYAYRLEPLGMCYVIEPLACAMLWMLLLTQSYALLLTCCWCKTLKEYRNILWLL